MFWTGSNDGPVWVTKDDGKTWKNVTPKDVPPGGRVHTIAPAGFALDRGAEWLHSADRNPLSPIAQELGFRIGLAIVLMLMIFATFNDILHLATS